MLYICMLFSSEINLNGIERILDANVARRRARDLLDATEAGRLEK